jgi:DNA-binding NarL/FixJ family response regulator
MPSPQAKPVHVSSLQQELLQQMAHRATSAQRLVKRAYIILEALKGTSNTSIAQRLQIDYETVRALA